MPPVLCLNGPNLDLLGIRQPEVYGRQTLADLETSVVEWGDALGFEVECLQSNDESELIQALHRATDHAGVLFNPGAFTHTSAALRDAVASIEAPVVEVHLSNIRSRDRWRRRSFLSSAAAATIFGRGREGYRAGLRHLANRRAHPVRAHRYGPHPDQVFDLRPGDSSVGVALLHGGFWLDAWGRDTTESWAVDLAGNGIPTANLEYRRMGSGGGSVATLSDVARGLQAATAALATERVAVVGHSAGAHLALWAAGRSDFTADLLISVAGILDLHEAAEAGRGEGAVDRFDASRSTSPLEAPPPPIPLFLVHGKDDPVIPASHTLQYARHLQARGASPRVSLLDGVRHFDALDPGGRLWDGVRAEIRSLVAPSPSIS